MTGILSVWLAKSEAVRRQQAFEQAADVRKAAFQQEFDDALHDLTIVNTFFSGSKDVNRDQFHDLAARFVERHPYVQAFSFSRTLSADRPHYHVIDQIAPVATNRKVIGLDISTLPGKDEATTRARTTGMPSATRMFDLLLEDGGHRAFAVMLPVYRRGSTARNVDARDDAVAGYTAVVLRAQGFVQSVMRRAALLHAPDIDVSILVDNENEVELVYQTGAPTHAGTNVQRLAERPSTSITRRIDAAGMRWLIVSTPTQDATKAMYSSIWMVMAGGVSFSILLALYLQSLAVQSAYLARSNAWLTKDMVSRKRSEIDLRAGEERFESLARKEAEQALRQSQTELRELTAHQARVKEDERKRIAREIHDDLGQNLLALRIDVSLLEEESRRRYPKINERIHAVLSQVDNVMRSVRAIVNDLRPPVLDLGLQCAFEWQVQQFKQRSGVSCTLAIECGDIDSVLDEEAATSLFRILQESLTNVSRHAHATHVDVRLQRKYDHLVLDIADNGVGGFPGNMRKPRSFGLIGIRERVYTLGGEFRMSSAPGKGTSLAIMIPVSAKTGYLYNSSGSHSPIAGNM